MIPRRAGIFGKLLAFAAVLIGILIAANFGTTWAAIEGAKDTHANNRVLADTSGGVLATGVATAIVPLFVLHAMDVDELGRVNHVTVSYENPEFDNKRVEHRLQIVQHMKVGVDEVILTDTLGFQVVLQGFAANLVKPNGDSIRLCGASATCASFQVDNADLKSLEDVRAPQRSFTPKPP